MVSYIAQMIEWVNSKRVAAAGNENRLFVVVGSWHNIVAFAASTHSSSLAVTFPMVVVFAFDGNFCSLVAECADTSWYSRRVIIYLQSPAAQWTRCLLGVRVASRGIIYKSFLLCFSSPSKWHSKSIDSVRTHKTNRRGLALITLAYAQ